MNFENIDTKITIYSPEYLGIESYNDVFFFHTITTGHYWRNSKIIELSLLHLNSNKRWILEKWSLEKESDEYDMLKDFCDKLNTASCLIGFNSNSFHIPYLNNKCKAYDLPNPLVNKRQIDLLKILKPIGKQLHISTKLNDLRILLNLPDELSEVECVAASTALFLYQDIFRGNFFVDQAKIIGDELLFSCKTETLFPASIRIHDEEFYLIGDNNDLKIKVKTESAHVKLYYQNYKDYYYIMDENIIIHKSLADTISKDKKRKAKPEECFSYISCTESFLSNKENQKKYLVALLGHFMQ